MASKHGKVVTYQEGHPPISLHNFLNVWSREVTWQIKNLHYLNAAYSHQTCQSGDILQETPTHKYAWSVIEAILRGHATN